MLSENNLNINVKHYFGKDAIYLFLKYISFIEMKQYMIYTIRKNTGRTETRVILSTLRTYNIVYIILQLLMKSVFGTNGV